MGPPDSIRQHRALRKQKATHSKGLPHQPWFMESGVFNLGCPLESPGGGGGFSQTQMLGSTPVNPDSIVLDGSPRVSIESSPS